MGFLDEVRQQAQALRDLAQFYQTTDGAQALRRLRDISGLSPRSVIFAGMGSSKHAARAAQGKLAEEMGVPVLVQDAGEMLHWGMEFVSSRDCIIAISQSGESVETAGIVRRLSGHPRLVSFTNAAGNTMERLSALNLPMAAGDESAISTKTFANALGLCLLAASALAGREVATALAELESAAEQMEAVWADHVASAASAAEALDEVRAMTFVGRGPSLANAHQAALTFQEGVRIHASALSGGAFRHGPMEISGPDQGVVLFAPAGAAGDLVRSMASEVAAFGSPVVLISSTIVEEPGIVNVLVPVEDARWFALQCAQPQALLLWEMARRRGITPGEFRYGSKVTTRE